MKELTDEDLMRRTQEKDMGAFNELFKRYRVRIRGKARLMLRDCELADEVLSDVFTKIWRRAETFQFNAKFSSWVYRITMNEVFMAMRKRKQLAASVPSGGMPELAALSEKANALTQKEAPQVKIVQLAQAAEEIRFCVEGISARNRVAAPYVEEPASEAAALLGVSEPAYKSKKHRVRIRFQENLHNCFAIKSILDDW